MREIKFRGYDEENKCWRYGHFFETVEGIRRCYNIVENRDTKYYVEVDSIGEFTGLYDKTGKEIYEGDIFSISNPYNNSTASGYAKVVFSYDYVGGWVLTSDGKDSLNIGTRTKSVEVVGNIYENPDLVRQDAERKSEELASNVV